MKISRNTENGSVLVVIFVTTAILGITLVSYLNLVKNQNITTVRSQQWNSAIPVAEAGIEEALTHLYHHGTNFGVNNWSLLGESYSKERYLGSNKYVVSITPSSPPTILAKGYVQVPLGTNFMEPPRTIRVTVTNDALFAKGMVAKGAIDLSGNNVRTDSFDSTDPNWSTGGMYDSAKARDNGDVATNSGLINSFNVGNADIWGKASTGPGGSISVGSNGAVGSKTWHNGGNNGIEPGWSTDDMNIDFPDVKPPFNGGGFAPNNGNVGGTNYNYVMGGGNWQMTSLSLSGQQKVLITGHAVLYVTGNVSMSGNSQIIIAPGATLKMYVAGSSASLGGNGVANQNGSAAAFSYFGLPTNTGLSLSGNSAFVGTVYAPSAAFTLGGGGNNNYDFVGASVTGSVRMNGHYKFHYDESLGKFGPRRGFTVTSWNEI